MERDQSIIDALIIGIKNEARLAQEMADWAAAGHPVDYAAYAEALGQLLPTPTRTTMEDGTTLWAWEGQNDGG